jgi:hypothetical protein
MIDPRHDLQSLLAEFAPLPRPRSRRPAFTLELGGAAPARVKNFSMETQAQFNWCWAAVSASVARKYDPNTAWSQCVVASALYAAKNDQRDCCGVDFAASDEAQKLSEVFAVTGNLRGSALDEPISAAALTAELRADRPVCARIAWNEVDGHFIAISGIRVGPDGVTYVEVRDPSYLDDEADNQKEITLAELTDAYSLAGGWWSWTYRTKPQGA